MFHAISPSASRNSRRTATLCSAALHAAAVAALWTAGNAISLPVPRHGPSAAVTIISPPPRLYRPRPRLRAAAPRFEVERAAATRTPAAVRIETQAPRLEARTDPAPMLPQEPAVAIPEPAVKPAGFAEVARAAPKPELEPRAAAFGSALGRPTAARALPRGGATAFGDADLAKTNSPAAAAGDSGFGGVEIGRARQQSASAEEAGFGAAERGLELARASEPAARAASNRPVRILWKPVPEYSEEGIRRRIEGEVVLLVRFLAQGKVETLKVVSGLGYGLDEYALRAAEAIRFEPATEGDRAVDSTAQVRIRFELAY